MAFMAGTLLGLLIDETGLRSVDDYTEFETGCPVVWFHSPAASTAGLSTTTISVPSIEIDAFTS
jgi:hypothetical protein